MELGWLKLGLTKPCGGGIIGCARVQDLLFLEDGDVGIGANSMLT